MIEGLAGAAANIFQNPIASTLVGFLPDMVDRIGDARYHFEKRRRLDGFVREYVYIAEAAGCPTVAKLLRTRGVIDELDACCDGAMSKEALARQLLSNAAIPEAERAAQSICLQFVSDYFDAKTWIDDEKIESAAARVNERVVGGFEAVSDKLDQIGGDIAARDYTTSLVLRQVASGSLTYEEVREHVHTHGRDGLAERMLGLYCDVLEGNRLDSSVLVSARSFTSFVPYLAACMVSAWRLDGLEQLAYHIGGELRDDMGRILPVIRGEKPISSVCNRDNVLEGFHDDNFAMLCIAEYAYYAKAFDVATWYFQQCSKPLNEIAKLHCTASELCVALINTRVVPSDVKSLVESIPSGVALSAVETAIDVANLGMELLESEDFEAVYSCIDEDRQQLCEQALSWKSLNGCTTEEAWHILRRADKRCHFDVFLAASDNLMANSNESEKVRRYWRGQTNMLCMHYSLLEFYLSRVDPEISAQEAEELVVGRLHDPVYELTLAEHFAGRDEGFYERCVERAISVMKDGKRGTIDIAHTHVWVPYLAERGRSGEIFDILAPADALPERTAADLVSLLWRSGVDEESIEGFIDDHAVWLHVSQPRSFYVLAAHCLNAGDYVTSIALGTKSFDVQPTVQAAQLVANAGNLGHLQVPKHIVDFLIKDDKAMSLYLAVGQLRIIEEDDLANDLLVRAVLLGGEGASQSAAALVGEWAGVVKGDTQPSVIGEDCAVSYVAEDGTPGTVVFHRRRRRVPNERRVNGSVTHLTVRSPEFVALEGKGFENVRSRRLGRIEIVGIESAEAYVLRLCFELMMELPDVTTLQLGDDPVGAISTYLQAREDAARPIVEVVTNGVTIEGGPRIYPGISTGSTLLGQSHLEFAFRALQDSRMALHRPPESQIASCEPGKFLLSASALTMIAIADLGRDCEELLWGSCWVTETTWNLLTREAELFRGQIDRSVCMLVLAADGRPALVPMLEVERQARRDLVARVFEILDRVRLYKPTAEDTVVSGAHRKRHVAIGINEAQDWNICRRDGLTYVTEDAVEALLITDDDAMMWCSLLQALALLGVSEPELSRCSVLIHKVGCAPSMGRSQALRAYDLLERRCSLGVEERETLLNYIEATGVLEHLEDARYEHDTEDE